MIMEKINLIYKRMAVQTWGPGIAGLGKTHDLAICRFEYDAKMGGVGGVPQKSLSWGVSGVSCFCEKNTANNFILAFSLFVDII